jgi:hypothetical protein
MADGSPSDASATGAPTPPPERGGPDTDRGGELSERLIAFIGRTIRGFFTWVRRFTRECIRAWGYLDGDQRVAAVGCALLIVSTLGNYSFVEAAEVLIALAVLALLRARALGRRFHLPLGDGTAIAAAGLWAAILIVVRLFDRPLGQNLLALACCAILVGAGIRERAKRPADDLAAEPVPSPGERFRGDLLEDVERRPGAVTPVARRRVAEAKPKDEAETEPLPPPEFEPSERAEEAAEPAEHGEQLSLTDSDQEGSDTVSSRPPSQSQGD